MAKLEHKRSYKTTKGHKRPQKATKGHKRPQKAIQGKHLYKLQLKKFVHFCTFFVPFHVFDPLTIFWFHPNNNKIRKKIKLLLGTLSLARGQGQNRALQDREPIWKEIAFKGISKHCVRHSSNFRTFFVWWNNTASQDFWPTSKRLSTEFDTAQIINSLQKRIFFVWWIKQFIQDSRNG